LDYGVRCLPGLPEIPIDRAAKWVEPWEIRLLILALAVSYRAPERVLDGHHSVLLLDTCSQQGRRCEVEMNCSWHSQHVLALSPGSRAASGRNPKPKSVTAFVREWEHMVWRESPLPLGTVGAVASGSQEIVIRAMAFSHPTFCEERDTARIATWEQLSLKEA
jgi:hypothetical protein